MNLDKKHNIQTIILAAGHGKRMGSDLPKVLVPMAGKPMVQRIIDAWRASRIYKPPVFVIGHQADLVQAELGPEFGYVYQRERLGTGHAVAVARDQLEDKHEDIMVLYGDHPFISAEMIDKLATAHIESGATLTLATAVVADFEDWRQNFWDFGRVLRDENGQITCIMEAKDASEAEKQVREINPAYFCFKAAWLWSSLEKLHNDNSQNEYYLTDLVGLAQESNEPIATVHIEPREALGANTPEQLALLEKLFLEDK
ncbi:MAG: NTP transferase domain-containing protein [bacterium]